MAKHRPKLEVKNTASKERKAVSSSQREKSAHQKGKAGSIIMTEKKPHKICWVSAILLQERNKINGRMKGSINT